MVGEGSVTDSIVDTVEEILVRAKASGAAQIKVQISEHVVIAAAFHPELPQIPGKREQETDDDDLPYLSS